MVGESKGEGLRVTGPVRRCVGLLEVGQQKVRSD